MHDKCKHKKNINMHKTLHRLYKDEHINKSIQKYWLIHNKNNITLKQKHNNIIWVRDNRVYISFIYSLINY